MTSFKLLRKKKLVKRTNQCINMKVFPLPNYDHGQSMTSVKFKNSYWKESSKNFFLHINLLTKLIKCYLIATIPCFLHNSNL